MDPGEALPKSAEAIELYGEVRKYAESMSFLTTTALRLDPEYRRLLKRLRSQQQVDAQFPDVFVVDEEPRPIGHDEALLTEALAAEKEWDQALVDSAELEPVEDDSLENDLKNFGLPKLGPCPAGRAEATAWATAPPLNQRDVSEAFEKPSQFAYNCTPAQELPRNPVSFRGPVSRRRTTQPSLLHSNWGADP